MLKETVVDFFVRYGFSNEAITVLVSMLPIFELRGGIPLAVLQFKIPLFRAFLLSVAGNIFPILPLLYFLDPIRNLLSKINVFKRFFDWLYLRAYRKGEEHIMKYGAIGLAVFVAIPLPVTGAWTGSVIALVFGIKRRYAFPSIIFGVLGAGIIVTILTAVVHKLI